MGKLLNAEADAMIEEAVEQTLEQYPDAEILRQPLRAWLRRRWPHVVRFAITLEASA
jgi:hypothetical protein